MIGDLGTVGSDCHRDGDRRDGDNYTIILFTYRRRVLDLSDLRGLLDF